MLAFTMILLFVGISLAVIYAEHEMSKQKRRWGENY